MPDTQYAVLGQNGTKVAVIDGALLTTGGSGGGGGGATEVTLAALSAKFPGAVLLTDDFANPTTTQIAAMQYVWDAASSNWDRQRPILLTPASRTQVAAVSSSAITTDGQAAVWGFYDAADASRIVGVGNFLLNGSSTWDRARGAVASGGAFPATGLGLGAGAIYLWNNGGTAFTALASPRGINDNNSLDAGAAVAPYKFNNSTYDKNRNNYEATVLASAARTAAINSADQTNYEAQYLILTIDVTAIVAAPSLTVSIKYKDTLSGKYINILTSAAIVATGTYTLQVGAGLTATPNLIANFPLPRIWRAEVAVTNTDSATYSISANYVN